MKRIMIRTGYLGLGAIEQLAFDIINKLSNKYKVIVAIENNRNNYLVKDLPENVEYFYLKTEKFEKTMTNIRNKKKNIFYKMAFNLFLTSERMNCYKNINRWIEKNGDVDLFIDYDGKTLKYIDKIKTKNKIVWQHTALSSEKNTQRMGKRLSNYDRIVLICEDMKKGYEKIFPELKEKLTVKYNFLDLERIKRMSKDYNSLSKEEKEMVNEKYAVAVARLDKPKDFNTLIEAFKILKEKGIDEKLYIVGDGELKKEIEGEIKAKHLEDTVFLLGRKNNPYIWMKNANLFVHSSKREGMPMVLLEAIACGKMVISSNCPTGPREILEDGKSGELYEVGNYQILAEILEKYIANEEQRKIFVENAEKRLQNFEQKKVLEEYIDFFDSLIGKQGDRKNENISNNSCL